MRVDIWSDIVCPWCYVGKRRFEKALATFEHRQDVQIVHRSFQLDPRSPRGQTVDRKQMLQQKYGWSTIQVQQADAQMTQLAAAEGLDYKLGGGVTGNTMDAHQVVHLARERGLQDKVLERLYKAHFVDQQSIFERETLVALGTETGLDTADIRDAFARDAFAEAVARDNTEARELGANGVPFFVVDHKLAVSGAQAVDVFGRALAQAAGILP